MKFEYLLKYEKNLKWWDWLLVICYSLLEKDDSTKLLAGKQEGQNAGMLKENRTFQLPSFPASRLQPFKRITSN
jgi:hypothetical protein